MAQGPSDTILVAIRITIWIWESKVRNPDPPDRRRFVVSEHIQFMHTLIALTVVHGILTELSQKVSAASDGPARRAASPSRPSRGIQSLTIVDDTARRRWTCQGEFLNFRFWDKVPEGSIILFRDGPIINFLNTASREACMPKKLDPCSRFDTISACSRHSDTLQTQAYNNVPRISDNYKPTGTATSIIHELYT